MNNNEKPTHIRKMPEGAVDAAYALGKSDKLRGFTRIDRSLPDIMDSVLGADRGTVAGVIVVQLSHAYDNGFGA